MNVLYNVFLFKHLCSPNYKKLSIRGINFFVRSIIIITCYRTDIIIISKFVYKFKYFKSICIIFTVLNKIYNKTR